MAQVALRQAGNWFETILSGLVIFIAVIFLIFAYTRTGTGHLGSYALTVRLPSAAGLDVGNDVRVGGVKVGSVSGLALDPADYSAAVRVSIRDDLSLPVDSTAKITSTVMGEVYLVITPGRAGHMIPPGGALGRLSVTPAKSPAGS